MPLTISAASSDLPTDCRANAPQIKAKLDAVFFDCDGVLADTERDGLSVSSTSPQHTICFTHYHT